MNRLGRLLMLVCVCAAGVMCASANAQDLVRTIAAIKPSIVGIGTYLQLRSPAISFVGTGFAVGDGLTIVTNAHVVPAVIDDEHKESLRVIIGRGNGSSTEAREASLLAMDRLHDLALLRIGGEPLPAMQLGDSDTVREGQMLAFTGFPLTFILGFHPATHRGMVAAITPIATQAPSSRSLDARAIVQLQRNAYEVFQLDGTAYPGGSGSPLYDPDSGVVLGVINKVVSATKEAAITNPSGITYAIPARFIKALMAGK